MKNKQETKRAKKIIGYDKGNTAEGLQFPIFELPTNLLYEIISRLPLKTIFSCRCVCRTFLKLIEDPYFVKTHLDGALSTSTTVIVKEKQSSSPYFRPYMLELDFTPKKSSLSSDHHIYHQHIISGQSAEVVPRDVKCCFVTGDATLISSCNGLLCLYSHSLKNPTYCICNPVSGECMTLAYPAPFTSDSIYLNHSGFGFCPKTKQYKVIRFMSSASTSRAVALVHTLGTRSWRYIGESPRPKSEGSFDCFLDGKLHLITASHKISDIVYAFDLETEKFEPVPMPAHFTPEYHRKVSWINVGVISGCLCLCYTSNDAYFEVFTMAEYGIRESWIKKFAIDVNYYCATQVEDLQMPIKFLNNGELLFLSRSNSLVSYSPNKRAFRDIKSLGNGRAEVIAHVSSFVSLKTHVLKRGINCEKIKLKSPMLVQNV